MSATNTTTNYGFPLFIGTDKPAWLVDWNGAMTDIDAAIKNVDTDLGSVETTLSGLSTTVAAHTSTLSTITGQIAVITTNVNSNTGAINTINSLIGNGTPTTTDQTIIGAINEINAKFAAIPSSGVSYDNTSSGLTATNVQAAIDELAAGTSFSVTGDGTKTWAQLLTELETALGNTALTMSSYIEHLTASGTRVRYGFMVASASTAKFSYAQAASTGGTTVTIDLKGHTKNTLLLASAQPISVTVQDTDVVPSGDVITLHV